MSSCARAAGQLLGKLDAATLALHAPAVVDKLEDPIGVRHEALAALGMHSAALADHAAAVVAKLEDKDKGVRHAAVQTLIKLDAATLEPLQWLHEAAIREKLAKWDSEERGESLKILRML